MKAVWKAGAVALVTPALLAAGGGNTATASSVKSRTIVDLMSLSEFVLVGQVLGVEDGFNHDGVPYTEVRLQVEESLKGSVGSMYTFRQFGLLKPRPMPDGRMNLNVTPDGWPRFKPGEKVMVFLYKAGVLTGFRTTVGLFQGKFTIEDGRVKNEVANRGLFRGVIADDGLLSDQESKLLGVEKGPVSRDAFVSFVKRALNEKWVDNGRIANAY